MAGFLNAAQMKKCQFIKLLSMNMENEILPQICLHAIFPDTVEILLQIWQLTQGRALDI